VNRARTATAVTMAALALFLAPSVTQESAWASPSRPSSPSGSKSRETSPSRVTSHRATPPTSVKPFRPGSSIWDARWDGTLSGVKFAVHGTVVTIWDIYRDKRYQPKGTGGQMIADSLRKAGVSRPSVIRVETIVNPPTVSALEAGAHPSETVLGKTVSSAAVNLGGSVNYWTPLDKLPSKSLEAHVTYP
jgi:hypothetical protein